MAVDVVGIIHMCVFIVCIRIYTYICVCVCACLKPLSVCRVVGRVGAGMHCVLFYLCLVMTVMHSDGVDHD
jgi:hypothetical protein